MRVSFERGFIDYIKHSNEQRINMLSEALEEQYSHHGNWVFLRNNDQVIYQIMRSFEQNSDSSHNLPPKGWRTQFWVVDSQFNRRWATPGRCLKRARATRSATTTRSSAG